MTFDEYIDQVASQDTLNPMSMEDAADFGAWTVRRKYNGPYGEERWDDLREEWEMSQ